MKRVLYKVAAVVIGSMIAQLGMASNFLNTKVTPQSLHVAGSAQVIPKPSGLVAADSGQSVNKSNAVLNDTTKANTLKLKNLAQQLSVLNQQMLLFQQNSDQRTDALVQQNVALKNRISSLTKAMSLLSQQLLSVSRPVSQKVEPPSPSWGEYFLAMRNFVMSHLQLIFMVVLGLLVCWLIFLLFPKKLYAKSVSPKDVSSAGVEDESEYDFMGSEEGLPAQLDLARAYLAMQDYAAMRSSLKVVFAKGDAEQKLAARQLLDNIPEGA